jgi:hypothetical protein
MKHGQDLDTVFMRLQTVLEDNAFLEKKSSLSSLRRSSIFEPGFSPPENIKNIPKGDISEVSFEANRMYVAGRTYYFVKAICHMRPEKANGDWWSRAATHQYFYSFDALSDFIEGLGYKISEAWKRYPFYDGKERMEAAKVKLNPEGFKEVYDELVERRIVILTLEENTINHITQYVWMTNCPLKHYEFFKVLAPYDMYQELEMYVSGVLGQQAKEVISIPDKYRIPQHGFDDYSFRKPPGEKKRRRDT